MTSTRSDRPTRWTREERIPTLDEIAWLTSQEGRDVCAAMHAGDGADTPAAIARWRQRLEPERVAVAWTLATLRAAAKAKFSRADEMLLDRVGLQQATDELIAAHKAQRFQSIARVADLCCGIGGDTLALAAHSDVIAVDWSDVRVAMAGHNAAVYGRTVTGRTSDVSFICPDADAAHIDPDRRAEGRRSHQPQFSSPDLSVLRSLIQRYRHVAVKLSPGADFAMLPFDAEIEVISLHRDCKQAVLWMGSLRQSSPPASLSSDQSPIRAGAPAARRATVLPVGVTLAAAAGESLSWPPPREPRAGCMLYEPDAAVIRADLVGVLARICRLAPLDPQIAYLVDEGPGAAPLSMESAHFLTPFRVIDATAWSLKRTRPWLADHDIGSLEVKTRGFAARPEEILGKLNLTGRRRAVLFLTRVADQPRAILAERP